MSKLKFEFTFLMLLFSKLTLFSNAAGFTPSIKIPLRNYKNQQYYGEIEVSKRKINVIFDTGSNYLWVQGKRFVDDAIDAKSSKVSSLKRSKQSVKEISVSTIKKALGLDADKYNSINKFSIKYGTGYIEGVIAKLPVKLSSQVSFKDFRIGVSIKEDENVFKDVPFEGILGLSFSSGNTIDMDALVDYLRLDEFEELRKIREDSFNFQNSIFYFDLNDIKSPSFNLGLLDKKYYKNELAFVDIKNSENLMWKLEVEKFSFDFNGSSYDLCEVYVKNSQTCTVVIDSGTSNFGAPYKAIKYLEKVLNIDQFCSNYDTLPDFTLSFKQSHFAKSKVKDFKITLKKEDYVIYSVSKPKKNRLTYQVSLSSCEHGFLQTNSNSIILGQAFLRKYLAVFDFERKIIGMSPYTSNSLRKEANYNSMVFEKDEMENLIDQFRINSEWSRVN